MKWTDIQKEMKQDPNITHQMLFAKMSPLLSEYYTRIEETVQERYEHFPEPKPSPNALDYMIELYKVWGNNRFINKPTNCWCKRKVPDTNKNS